MCAHALSSFLLHLSNVDRALHVVEPHLGSGHLELVVKELCLDHHVAVEDARWHHLRLGRSLDQGLPRVGRIWDDEAELEVPLLEAATTIQHLLFQPEFLHGLE